MQDIHSITGGRIFGGGGAGDRRLRPQHHQALKCPRCDSLKTKFCYYNNYNLSQPRHFCKSCRRYWTKGGVLRNVPVGGGCRKAKRSKAKSSAPSESSPVAAECAAATTAQARDRKTSSHSSSESSSLTGATTGEAVSTTSSITPSSFLNNIDYKSIIAQSMNAPPSNHGFDHELLEQSSGCGLFSEMGSFANLMTSPAEPLPFGFSGALDQNSHWSQHQDQEQKIQPAGELTSSDGGGTFLSQTVPVDLYALQGRQLGSESFGALDWQPAADQMLFDLPGAVDQAYWSQNSQWTDEDHQPGLYLPQKGEMPTRERATSPLPEVVGRREGVRTRSRSPVGWVVGATG